ncbi:MAG: hypothetical protein ABSB66_15220 [Candidatus Acidiferrales bacterium]
MKHLVKTAILGTTLALVSCALQAQTKAIDPGQTSVAMSSGFLSGLHTFGSQEAMNANQSETVPQALGLRTVVGCLSMTAGTYVIAGGAPGPKQFRIVSGDVSSLKGKTGRTIKVVGIVGKNDALANQNGLYNEGSTTGVGYLTIEAQQISQVAFSCEGGKESAGGHK